MNYLTVINGLVTNLSAASALGPGAVGKDYGVLESVQTPSAVVSWLDYGSTVSAFGGVRDRGATFLVQVFLKDTGSASALMDSFPTTMSKVVASIESDETIQGSLDAGEYIADIRASREIGNAITNGTVTLFPFDIEIDVYDITE